MNTVRVSATVPSGVQPVGTVTFYDGPTPISLEIISSDEPSSATLTTASLGLGSHAITGVFRCDANFNPSTTAVIVQVSQPAPPQVKTPPGVLPAGPSGHNPRHGKNRRIPSNPAAHGLHRHRASITSAAGLSHTRHFGMADVAARITKRALITPSQFRHG
jgi:hypothetical protein